MKKLLGIFLVLVICLSIGGASVYADMTRSVSMAVTASTYNVSPTLTAGTNYASPTVTANTNNVSPSETANTYYDSPTVTADTYYVSPTITANTYYVSPTGKDTNAGTIDTPFKTIAKGVRVLEPGDTLYIRSGTYLLTSTLRISHSGNETARIIISTLPGDPTPAIISGDMNGNGIADTSDTPGLTGWYLIRINGSYITFKNLEVKFSGRHGITSYGHDNIISNNKVHDIWYGGITVRGANSIIEGNTVYRAVDSNYCGGVGGSRGCNGNWTGGITWGDTSQPFNVSPNTIIRNNTVYYNSGEGLLCMQTEGGLVEGNVVYDNWGMGIDLDQCGNITIQKNLLYYTSDKNWWRGGTYPSDNIMISNEGSSGYTVIAHDNTVINNIMIGGANNFKFWKGEIPSGLINTLIANNTFINSYYAAGASLYIDTPFSGASHSNSRITNNLFFQSSGTIAKVGTTNGLSFDHNLWSKIPPSNVSGVGDIIANPLLVDANHVVTADSVIAEWYKLISLSPAIDNGTTVVIKDYFGTTRPVGAGYDMGAHEYSGVTTPTVSPTNMPSPIFTQTLIPTISYIPTPTWTSTSIPTSIPIETPVPTLTITPIQTPFPLSPQKNLILGIKTDLQFAGQ